MEIIQLASFVIAFSLLALFVKGCRITSIIILVGAVINLVLLESYNTLAAHGETVQLIIMSCFDLLAAIALIMVGDGKRYIQAFLYTLFVFCHAELGIELFTQRYFIYDHYEYYILVLNMSQILVMGGYYNELIRNIRKLCANFFLSRFPSFNFTRAVDRLHSVQNSNEKED